MFVNINDKSVELKFSFKAEMLFEQINEKTFTAQSTTEWIQYFFCIIIAELGDGALKFEDFIKILDEQPGLLFDFMEWYTTTMTNINQMRLKKVEDEKGTEKSRKKDRK